jgi:small subunit ribosomal protein S17
MAEEAEQPEQTAEPEAAAAPAAEPQPPAARQQPASPKERRRGAKAAKAAAAPARAARGPQERQAERDAERRRKALVRRRRRLRERERARAARAQTPAPAPVRPREHAPGRQKTRQGVVVSDKAAKTITVRIDVTRRHPRYEKIVRTSRTLHAHDERDEAHVGDTVIVRECRPMSRTKRWRLVEIVQRAA